MKLDEMKFGEMKFEDIASKNDGELFEKTKILSQALASRATGNEGLGVQVLEKISTQPFIKEKNGKVHQAIMFGSNSYLNLTTHPQVMDGARNALEKYGYGMGAVSLYAGITDLHKELEARIADFYHAEDAILFPSGYGTNVGVISALCSEGNIIINDSANHSSIFDGSRLSGADLKVYPHGNLKYLEKLLSEIPDSQKGRLIITDGVFSMHGDMAKLDEIYELAKKYNARLMVDDAHGIGIVGPNGRGTAEHFDLLGKIDLNVGMLSKTPGGVGGYCAAKKEVIDYLRLYSRTYFFSTALPAPVVGGLIEIFKLLEHDKAGRKELWDNITYIKNSLDELGFNTGETESGIIPIIVGDEDKLISMCNELRSEGVYTNIVTYPAVRRKECRIRLCVMKDLSKEEIDKAINLIAKKGREYGLIK